MKKLLKYKKTLLFTSVITVFILYLIGTFFTYFQSPDFFFSNIESIYQIFIFIIFWFSILYFLHEKYFLYNPKNYLVYALSFFLVSTIVIVLDVKLLGFNLAGIFIPYAIFIQIFSIFALILYPFIFMIKESRKKLLKILNIKDRKYENKLIEVSSFICIFLIVFGISTFLISQVSDTKYIENEIFFCENQIASSGYVKVNSNLQCNLVNYDLQEERVNIVFTDEDGQTSLIQTTTFSKEFQLKIPKEPGWYMISIDSYPQFNQEIVAIPFSNYLNKKENVRAKQVAYFLGMFVLIYTLFAGYANIRKLQEQNMKNKN